MYAAASLTLSAATLVLFLRCCERLESRFPSILRSDFKARRDDRRRLMRFKDLRNNSVRLDDEPRIPL